MSYPWVPRPKRSDTTPPDRTNTALDKAFARRIEMLQFKARILCDFQIPSFVRKALLSGRYKVTGKNQGGKRVPITREDIAGLGVDLKQNCLIGGGGSLVFDAIAIVPIADTTITNDAHRKRGPKVGVGDRVRSAMKDDVRKNGRVGGLRK